MWSKTSNPTIAVIIITLLALAGCGRLPQVIFQAPPIDENLVQWRRNWREADDSIVSATVVSEAADELFVYVDYIYSGNHGDEVTTCGNIKRNGDNGRWTCAPGGIRRGRGFVTLRFGLSSKARDIECSDAVAINFYDERGVTFFEKIFPFNKTWVKGGKGMYGKIRESLSVCPSTQLSKKDV